MHIARSLARYPTPMWIGGPGTWRRPRWAADDGVASALEQAGQRARERSAYDVASRAFERGAAFAEDDQRRGRLLYAAADAAWLGGLSERVMPILEEAIGTRGPLSCWFP